MFELGEQPLPVTRSAVRFYGLTGGVHVSISEVGGEKRATVDFLDQYGANLKRADERKLESIFSREDFLRAEAEDIKDVEELYEYKLYYLREIINRAKSRDMGFKILVQSASSWGQRLAASAAKDLGVTAEIRTGELDLSDTLAVGAFCRDVAAGGYDLGAIFDRAAQTLTLVDEGGSVITPDLYKAMCALVVMETYPGAEIAARRPGAVGH